MPVQRRIFGRNIKTVPPRKLAVLLGTIAVFAVITLVFTLPNSIPSGPSLGRFTDHKIALPKLPKVPSASILNPFRQAAHPPPVQKNSTSGESSWYSNWNWLSPFSSSVTLDENRSLLPPLAERPPIYTYFDHTLKMEKELKEAQNELLVTWRKAWWAQGFRPIILSPAEAVNNPLYKELQLLDIDASLKIELQRWLAWETMGSGLLCNYLLLPMGGYDDPLLSYLRRGEYPRLTRYDKVGSGLFSGSKADITAALKQALDKKDELKNSKDFIGAVTADTFRIEPKVECLAYYDTTVIKDKYSKISDAILGTGPKGLKILNRLMTAHLHSTWQNSFSKGIAVLKPHSKHMTALVDPARGLARFLSQCPDSPMPASCPPNRPRCKPCVASIPLKISGPEFYRNTSELYTIGTVPHPYTLALLMSFKDSIDVRWIRRDSERDQWLFKLTQELLGSGVSGPPRVVKFKDAVASDHGRSHSIWLTAEKDAPSDLDWYFGFHIPTNVTENGKSETPVPGPERRPKPETDPKDGKVPEQQDLEREYALIKKAKEIRHSTSEEDKKVLHAIEAWNLADTEAWKFARAYLARSLVERLKWEEEERKYAGGAGAERGRNEGWGRWHD